MPGYKQFLLCIEKAWSLLSLISIKHLIHGQLIGSLGIARMMVKSGGVRRTKPVQHPLISPSITEIPFDSINTGF